MAFCLPNHHYQWTVMPFGLKNALLQFQKAMVTIFKPIMHNALVYIDDILLFSPDRDSSNAASRIFTNSLPIWHHVHRKENVHYNRRSRLPRHAYLQWLVLTAASHFLVLTRVLRLANIPKANTTISWACKLHG